MLFFLYGEDSFRSLEKVLEIKKKFQLNDKSGAGLSSFDATQEEVVCLKIESALKNSGLFSAKKLIILRNCLSSLPTEEQTKLLAFLKKNSTQLKNDFDAVLIFWEQGLPRKNNPLFKFLLAEAKKQQFEKLSGTKLNEWIAQRIEARSKSKMTISRPALEKLIFYTEGNTALISQEIEKLINFSEGKIIDENSVDCLLASQSHGDIFRTIEALSANKKKVALKLLEGHFDRGDDAFSLFSMFLYQFRNLLRIASLQEKGVPNEGEIVKITKLHPYVVKKSLSHASRFGFEKLKTNYAKLGLIDEKIKTGQININLALEKFIVEL